MLETDGPCKDRDAFSLCDRAVRLASLKSIATADGGTKCESTNHSHHHGLEDSVYRQTQLQSAFYADMRRLNVYVNQPDTYFFQGGSRTGMVRRNPRPSTAT